jgi:hypothetical protein
MKNDDDEYESVEATQTNTAKVAMFYTVGVVDINIVEPVKVANLNTAEG